MATGGIVDSGEETDRFCAAEGSFGSFMGTASWRLIAADAHRRRNRSAASPDSPSRRSGVGDWTGRILAACPCGYLRPSWCSAAIRRLPPLRLAHPIAPDDRSRNTHMSAELRILALETAGLSGTVAALSGDRVLAESELTAGTRSAQSLAPGIAELWRDVGWRASDVELIAVTIGPGSFTGLRVGVTTAKTLAYATGAAVLGIDTLETIASQSPADIDEIWTVLDAQRSELFAARWKRADTQDPLAWQAAAPAAIVDGGTWAAGRSPGVAVSGPPLRRWRDRLPAEAIVVAEEHWQPQAATVGRLAWRKHVAGHKQDLWTLSPNYLRLSAAEEKLASAE